MSKNSNDEMIGVNDIVKSVLTGHIYRVVGITLSAGVPAEYTLVDGNRHIHVTEDIDEYTPTSEWDDNEMGVIG